MPSDLRPRRQGWEPGRWVAPGTSDHSGLHKEGIRQEAWVGSDWGWGRGESWGEDTESKKWESERGFLPPSFYR